MFTGVEHISDHLQKVVDAYEVRKAFMNKYTTLQISSGYSKCPRLYSGLSESVVRRLEPHFHFSRRRG